MAEQTIYEKGDSLEALAIKAKQWFIINNVQVPTGATNWQKCSVRKGEIPPGTGVTSLRRYGFNVTAFINAITGSSKKVYRYNPITQEVLEQELGFLLVSESFVKGHKKLVVRCTNCNVEGEIDYGTLQRMRKAKNRCCYICRGSGGKHKPLEMYNKFDGFNVIYRSDDNRLVYQCTKCDVLLERTLAHISTTEYLVCEKCYPRLNFGARHYTELGYFDSKIEYEAYKVLLSILGDSNLIIRQKKYDELFNTNTKHTADFYIPSLSLVLEVTSENNKIGEVYKQTAKWKQSVSSCVKFAYSLSEVEDIVRSAMKVAEVTVSHSRNVLCCRVKRRQKPSKSLFQRRRLSQHNCQNGVQSAVCSRRRKNTVP